jgi:hypothetical protein
MQVENQEWKLQPLLILRQLRPSALIFERLSVATPFIAGFKEHVTFQIPFTPA